MLKPVSYTKFSKILSLAILHNILISVAQIVFPQCNAMQCCLSKTSAIVLRKIGSGKHSDPNFGWRVGGFSYIDARKRIWNAVPACVLLRKLPEGRSSAFRYKIPPEKM
jgi:hypothetical protein